MTSFVPENFSWRSSSASLMGCSLICVAGILECLCPAYKRSVQGATSPSVAHCVRATSPAKCGGGSLCAQAPPLRSGGGVERAKRGRRRGAASAALLSSNRPPADVVAVETLRPVDQGSRFICAGLRFGDVAPERGDIEHAPAGGEELPVAPLRGSVEYLHTFDV